MAISSLLRDALDLTEDALDFHVEVPVHELSPDWNKVAIFHLLQAHDTLNAVSLTINSGLVTSSRVLVRHLFELAVRLRFMEACPEERVPCYMEYSRLNCAGDGNVDRKIRTLHEQGDYVGAMELMVPDRPWGNLKNMCTELGLLEAYGTAYRLMSHSAHGGGHRLWQELTLYTGQEEPPVWELPGILYTALTCYIWVIEINRNTFPKSELEVSPVFAKAWQARLEALRSDMRSCMSPST